MNAFRRDLQQVQNDISSGNLEFALQKMEMTVAVSRAENRERLHWCGKILMRQGKFEKAIALFLEAIHKFGNHVGIVLDLAACYYLTGQMYSWSQALDLAEYELKKNKHLIEFTRLTNCLLLLAKFKEEIGAIHEAIELYEENLFRFTTYVIDRDSQIQKLRIQAQILRIHSEHGQSIKVLSNYNELNQVNAKETNWDCEFEVEHALLIFEAKYFGLQHARARFEKLCLNPLLQTAESTLVITDMLYESLASKGSADQDLVEMLNEKNELSPYERQILTISQNILPTSLEVLSWPETMSPAQTLRIYTLLSHLRSQRTWLATQEQDELHLIKLFKAATVNLSGASRKTWERSLKPIEDLSSTKKQFLLHMSQSILTTSHELEPLTLSRAQQELLLQFSDKATLNLDVAIQKLWNGRGDENDLARLRMRVTRLNKQASQIWDINSLFVISDQQIQFLGQLMVSK